MSVLPFTWQVTLGKGMGRLFGKVARGRRHIAKVNLTLCFPELSKQRQAELLEEHFTAIGMGVCELAMAWWGSDKKLRKLMQVEGLEHLDEALAQGKGVILLTGHFTMLELGARAIAMHRPFHAIYRPHKNPLFESVMRQMRERHSGLATISRGDLRGMIRGLRQGHAIWYAPDQNYGAQGTLFVPFFGIPALTITATSRLAKVSGAPVVPYFPQRLAGAAGYRVTILPALENFPSEDAQADTRRINQLIEEWIRRIPEQYLWVHRRFKTRPQGEPSFYAKGVQR